MPGMRASYISITTILLRLTHSFDSGLETTAEDSKSLVNGSFLWKVRKKKILGIRFFRRKFRINFKKLYIHYIPAPNKITFGIQKLKLGRFFRLDMANIVEVRTGFSTDTFNEVHSVRNICRV